MQIRLLLDEDVHLSLGQALSKRGYDAVHVQEIQRKLLSNKYAIKLNFSNKCEHCLPYQLLR